MKNDTLKIIALASEYNDLIAFGDGSRGRQAIQIPSPNKEKQIKKRRRDETSEADAEAGQHQDGIDQDINGAASDGNCAIPYYYVLMC